MNGLKGLVLGVGIAVLTGGFSYGAEFADMPNDEFRECLEYSVERGLLKGDNGRIDPDKNISVAEMVTILNRAFENQEVADIKDFKDVKEGDWFYPEIAKGVGSGIIKGDKGKIGPRESISYERALVILNRAYGVGDQGLEYQHLFNQYPSWARAQVSTLFNEGHLKGVRYVDPKRNITRKEFAKIIYNIENGAGEPDLHDIHGNSYTGAARLVFDALDNLEDEILFKSEKTIEQVADDFNLAFEKVLAENSIDYGYNGFRLRRYSSGEFALNIVYTSIPVKDIKAKDIRILSKEEMKTMKDQVNEKADQVVAEYIKDGMSDLEKARILHDYIVENGRYDHEQRNIRNNHISYGILIDGIGVCESYSKAYQILCEKAGLESLYIKGSTAEGAHGWKLVKIDGNWRHVDTTYDDAKEGQVSHRYFNLTDAEIKRTHTIYDKYRIYPKAD